MKIMSFWWAKAHPTVDRADAKTFLSDVFPRGACRKTESAGNGVLSSGEKNFSVHKTYMNFSRPRKRAPETALYALRGRSMVEMLGVLAIIGVLSVGAISGYQKAMFKYKLNKTVQQYNSLIGGLLEHYESLKKIDVNNAVYLAPYIEKLNLLPDGMKIVYRSLEDSFGNRNAIIMRHERIVIDYVLSNNADANGKICAALFSGFIIPFQDNVYEAWIYRGAEEQNGSFWYGNKQCANSARKCLKDMTMEDISSTCSECSNYKRCILAIEIQ